VPAGGLAGQVLVKTSNSDWATGWTTLSLTQYLLKASNLSDLTNVTTARDNLGLGNTNSPTFLGIDGQAGGFNIGNTLKGYSLGTAGDGSSECGFQFSSQSYVDDGEGNPIIGNVRAGSYGEDGLSFSYRVNGSTYRNRLQWDGSEEGKLVVSSTDYSSGDLISSVAVGPTSITFPNASVQTIAFPGFNNAALTGNPTAPTPATSDNDTSIATTAFVQAGLLGGTANARNLEVQVRNQSGSTIPAGSIVYISGATGNLPLITLAQANNDANSAQTIGFVKTAITNNGTGYVIVRGVLEAIDTSALTEGVQLYLSPTTAGTWTTTKPSAPQHLVYVGVVIRSHPTQGTILVAVQNGYELHELHDVALASEANNDLLVYELSTDLWKNKSFATLGLAGLNSPTFTGTPSLPTGTIGVTQTAGDNTTALATTAFVTASNPDASTTVKGHVELATNAEVIAGTSTSLVSSLSNIPAWVTNPELRSFAYISSTAISGSGANSSPAVAWGLREMFLNTLATGRSSFRYGLPATAGVLMSKNDRNKIDFSKKIWLSGKCCLALTAGATSYLGDANTMARITLGGYTTVTTGDMTVMGIGFKKVGGVSSNIVLTVHNGTSLTDVTSSKAVAADETIDWVIYSDGTGNVTLYVDGVQIATTSSGPTGLGANLGCTYNEQIEATTTPGVRGIIQATGGYMFIEL
jgi:hypothetical protein